MSDFAKRLLPQVKKTLREASSEFDDEIGSYIDTVATDLQNVGILSSFFTPAGGNWEPDPQILQACRWYALSVFGLYNADMEKYAKAYASLKATLATQRVYTEKPINGDEPDSPDEPIDQTALAGAYTPDGTFSNREYTWDEMVANFENGTEPSYGVDEYDGTSLHASGYDVIIPDTVTDAGWLVCTNVVLPATTTHVGRTDNLEFEKIYIKATTPPELESGAFDEMLYSSDPEQLAKFAIVPEVGYGDAYKSATNWSAYADYIKEGAMPI